MLELTRFF